MTNPLAPSLSYHAASPSISRGGLLVVLALHLLAFWLLVHGGAPAAPIRPAVLSVNLVPPAVPALSPPRPPAEARPRPLRSVENRPAPLARPTLRAEAAETAAPTLPQPTPLPAAAPAPAPSAALIAPSTPRFDAAYLDNPKPAYPALSRRLGEEGTVVLRVRVQPDGRPEEIQLHTPSGSPRLDQSAQDAVRRWRFVPARRGEEAVAAWVLVPIAFTLKE